MNNRNFILLFICFLPLLSFSQKPTWQWVSIDNNIDDSWGSSIVMDANSNIYATGSFRNTITLDTFTFTSNGNYDVIITKYNALGQLKWAKGMGGHGDDASNNSGGSVISVDATGNIYLSFPFSDTMVVDGQTFISKGGRDIALMKLDSNGNLIWGKSYGSVFNEYISKLLLKENNLYLCGMFSDAGTNSIQFDSITLITHGSWDIFLLKADTMGHIFWAKNEGNTLSDMCGGITVDLNNNIYITGSTGGNLKLDHDTLWDVNAVGMNFVIKYDSTGNELWAKGALSTTGYYGGYIDADTNGNIYISGYTINDQSINFGALTLSSQGYNKTYLVKYSSSGQLLFAKNISTYTFYDEAQCLRINPIENAIYLCGQYNYLATFGNDTLPSYGHDDILVLKMDENGNVIWTTHAGGNINDGANGLAVAPNGDVAITGYTASNNCQFGNHQVSATDAWDMFVAKLSQTTGISNEPDQVKAEVYPNPANETIYLKSKDAIGAIKVYDITGKMVKEMKYETPTTNISLDVRGLTDGMYFMEATAKGKVPLMEKMVISH